PAPKTPPPAPLGVIGRFALYLGLSILFAAGALGIAIFSGAVPGGRWTLWTGWVLTAAGTAAMIVAERATVGVSWRTLLSSSGAGYALLVISITGTFRAIHELGGLSAWRRVFEASYGITLTIKVGVAIVLIGFGALNRYRNLPRVRAGGGPTGIHRSIAA